MCYLLVFYCCNFLGELNGMSYFLDGNFNISLNFPYLEGM